MNDVKCQCGHVNPHGTVLCESCGKILNEAEKDTTLVDMRYEGSARRSQVYKKTVIDKVWNFFSSVKVGVGIIIAIVLAASLGTILPQEVYKPSNLPSDQYYAEEYGWFGKLYYLIGLHKMYESWWFLLLIAMLGISLVICSLDRFIPLRRALKNQRVTRHEGFLKRQRLYGITDEVLDEETFQKVKTRLVDKRYKIREENGNILAEKGRFSRWGPYVNHIGLILFLAGAMLRFVPGLYVNKMLWIAEDETKVIPGTNEQYFLKNNQFTVDMYDKNLEKKEFSEALEKNKNVVKEYESQVTLFHKVGDTIPGEDVKLEEIKDFSIKVNIPLKYDHYALYQSGYDSRLSKMNFDLVKKDSKESIGSISVNLDNPETVYNLGEGYSVNLVSYFPDFEFDENKQPSTKSRYPNNPAFVFKMISPKHPEGELSFVAIQQTLEPEGENDFKMQFSNAESKFVTALTVRKDLTLPILGIGGLIFMIGVIQGAYWNHRRIWIQRVGDQVIVACHTNKNWFGIKKELGQILEETTLQFPNDQVEAANDNKAGGKADGSLE